VASYGLVVMSENGLLYFTSYTVVGADLLATKVELQKDYGIPQVRALGIMLDDNAAKEALDNIVDILKKQ